jgi:hypothetical protein
MVSGSGASAGAAGAHEAIRTATKIPKVIQVTKRFIFFSFTKEIGKGGYGTSIDDNRQKNVKSIFVKITFQRFFDLFLFFFYAGVFYKAKTIAQMH